MAWNTEETKRRLKQAATEEFAARGLHGTTMDRIAQRAGLNKERLYNYFGDKERLFATVLSEELAKVAAAVPAPEPLGDDDLGEYAGRLFDYHAAHPQLIRLLHWEALAYGSGVVPDERARTAHYREKAAALAAAQEQRVLAREPHADHLLFMILALAAWWVAVPQVARMVTGAKAGNRAERARRRAAVVTAAQRLAAQTQHSSTTPTRTPDARDRARRGRQLNRPR
jgi:AcrR family transcriptional regulator